MKATAAADWSALAVKQQLAEPDVDRLVSWWHTDGDLGRKIECVNDLTQGRLQGFHAYQPTPSSFVDLFDRLKAEGLIPSF